MVALDATITIIKYILKGSINHDNSHADALDHHVTDDSLAEDHEESAVLHFGTLYYTDLSSSMMALALKLLHFIHIWVLNGLSFTLIDAILFLNMRFASFC